MDNILKIAMAQISPVWLNKVETLKKVENSITAGKASLITWDYLQVSGKLQAVPTSKDYFIFIAFIGIIKSYQFKIVKSKIFNICY